MAVSLVRDARFAEHFPGPGHAESPARLASIEAALRSSTLRITERPARPATETELGRVHTRAHVARMAATEGHTVVLDPDTVTSPGTHQAALLGAGSTIDLARAVSRGEAAPGIVLARPPGHHATRDTAMGFCLFNNVAAAASALIEEGLAQRVAIYDFDFHHGNGTEAIFYADPRVLYVSTHQMPAYPGTGESHRTGMGEGVGTNLNVPLAPGSGDDEVLHALDHVIAPRVRAFAPDALLISAGFDALDGDPLGGLSFTIDGYAAIGTRLLALADEVCGGRISATLEGGYDIERLGAAVVAFLGSWDR